MDTPWCSKTIPEAFQILESSEDGLTKEEAASRLEKYGLNKLPEQKPDSLFLIFIRQFQSPLIYILIVASVIVFLLGEVVDGVIILFVLLFNAVIGTIQEGKAQNTLLALKNYVKTQATVIRDGKEIKISDEEVVIGDVIVLREGDKIPADARIFESNNLTLDEAALTGESITVHKTTDPLNSSISQIGDQKNMLFKGTNVVAGNGKAIVVSTGIKTFFGKISKEVSVIDSEIPLKKNIRYLTRAIIVAVLIICTAVFLIGIFAGNPVKTMFAIVVSIAVSIVPEGLPIVMTLILATGVWRMSKRNALVKKLFAVESLGQANVIAVDKTGTLTENEIILQKLFINNKEYDVTGSGYNPTGEIFLNNQKVSTSSDKAINFAATIAALGSDDCTSFSSEKNSWVVSGDPTDAALSVFGKKVGFDKKLLEKDYKKLADFPFDYQKKYHVSSYKIKNEFLSPIIGAPEEILEIASKMWQDGKEIMITPKQRKELEQVLAKMYKQGLRVIAFAVDSKSIESSSKIIKDIAFVGFFGLKDALRIEVKEAVQKAIFAGIKVVMITGDHKITGEAIAKEAGIFKDSDVVLTGDELDSLSEEEFLKILPKVSVFARVTPSHKLKIVQAYKKLNKVIAMTGDGVNDAPSLVAADLGVSMGKIGTEVAKEASDIVLLDDNFASIVSAVEEGRSIYKTIKKVIVYLFSTGLGEVLTIAGGLLIGLPLPLLAAQIVWLNFVTDGFLDVSLSMEPKEEGLLKGNFERPKKYLLDRVSIERMLVMAIPMMIGTLWLFNHYNLVQPEKALTVSMVVLALFQWFNALNCRHETKSIFQTNPFSNKFLLGALLIVFLLQLFAVYNPVMNGYLSTSPLNFSEWVILALVASSIIIAEELRKLIHRLRLRS